MKNTIATIALLALAASTGACAATPPTAAAPAPKYKKIVLSDKFYAEGAHFGDFNKDGHIDIVAGPFWFAGPDFKKRYEIYPTTQFDPKGYSDNFTAFVYDFNGDGWDDVFICAHPGTKGYWYENPKGANVPWKKHFFPNEIGNESPQWIRMKKDDPHPSLVYNRDGFLGYSTLVIKDGAPQWTFHPISPENRRRYQRYTHGIGAGDINGDGRTDIIENEGWWEQPEDASKTPWIYHKYESADPVPADKKSRAKQRFAAEGAHMFIFDVNGDGLPDVVTAWNAHLYGLVWHEQVRDANGKITWRRHDILAPEPDLNSPALRISQMHAVDIADINGDGLPDIVTGKRFWAHGPKGDKEPDAPAVLYWFELKRDKSLPGGATFIPHKIDDDSGVGTQVVAADINGDKIPDIIVANKKGIFLHLSEK